MSIKPITIAGALLIASSSLALAQTTGASPADPNNERNQRPAMSNSQPSDPAADSIPEDRIPTDTGDAASADNEEGGASGGSTGEAGSVELDPEPVLPSEANPGANGKGVTPNSNSGPVTTP